MRLFKITEKKFTDSFSLTRGREKVKGLAKTELTVELEKSIYSATSKQGVFGCLEVTIGWFGNERVDYMTYDTKGIFRCYEIKVTKSDFHSKAHNTFLGHYNYYVMPRELYEQVKDEIPKHIGVFVDGYSCVKNAKRQELGADEQVLKNSLIRSLCRESEKLYKSENPNYINNLKKQISVLEKEKNEWKKDYYDIYKKVRQKYGRDWDADIVQQEATI